MDPEIVVFEKFLFRINNYGHGDKQDWAERETKLQSKPEENLANLA